MQAGGGQRLGGNYNTTSGVFENFLSGQSRDLFKVPAGYLDLGKTPISNFTSRLQLLINTYNTALLSPTILSGQLNDLDPQALLNGTEHFNDGGGLLGGLNVSFTNTTASRWEYSNTWRCDII